MGRKSVILEEISREVMERIASIIGPYGAAAAALEKSKEYEEGTVKFFRNPVACTLIVTGKLKEI